MKKLFLFVINLVLITNVYSQTDKLRNEITEYLIGKDLKAGISFYSFTNGDTLSINGDDFFPMQSVFKFHIGLAILNKADKGELNIEDKILIKKEDLKENTWSPIREINPEGNFSLTIAELLSYSVSESDNNACDILIEIAGGTEQIQKYFDDIGLKDFYIVATEYEMHRDWETQFRNKTTPKSSTEIIKKIYSDNLFSKKSFDFLYKIMTETKTGQKRIKEQLPEGSIIGHKTGTSGKNDGIIAAVNDIAFISLPNGFKYILSIYLTDSKLDYPEAEKVMSDISKIVSDFYK